MIKVNSVRNKNVARKVANNYNKSSAAKEAQEVEQVNEDEVVEAIIELKEEVAEEEASVAEEVVEETAEEVEEEASEEIDFESMTKDELEVYARENLDLELDKRKKKSDLITEVVKALVG